MPLLGGSDVVSADAGAFVAEQSDAPVMEPRTRAVLRIDSVPAGARVVVNGTALDDVTPTSVPVAPDEPNMIRLELEGYEPWEDPAVQVPTGETLRIRPRLSMQVASLLVTTRPEGVTVVLGGERLGVTPLERNDLRPGRGQTLTLRKEGFRPVTVRIDLDVGRATKVERTLKNTTVFGRIDLHIDDGWAEVYLRGRKIGRAPARGLKLPVGKHKLRLVNPPTKRERVLEVEVVQGETRYYRTRL